MPRSLKISRASPTHAGPLFRNGWAWEKMKAPQAWRALDSAAGQGLAASPAAPITVAIVDWGIQRDHEALVSTPLSGYRVIPPYGDDSGDDDGHGTMLAGTIAAIAGGVASAFVRLMAVKFIDVSTPPMSGYAAAAIRLAVERGARVINASWDVGYDSLELRQAIELAADNNVLLVAAAGNSGGDNGIYPTFPASLGLRNMISVMASDRSDQKPGFSNYGDNVDIAAPGVDIVSASPYLVRSDAAYRSYSGTSAAAACVSAAAALLLSINPGWPPETIRELLMATADPDPGLRGLCRAAGRLNLLAAVEEARRRAA